MRFVVTGTDTDVGKTVFCAGLAGLLGARYWKPVQAGFPTDSQTVAALAGVEILPEAFASSLPPRRTRRRKRKASPSIRTACLCRKGRW